MLPRSFKLFIIYLISLLLLACGGVAKKKADLVVWPSPPELPRFAHEVALYTELDIVKVSQGELFRRAVVGEDPKARAAFIKPFDVAAGGGRIFVSDTMANVVHLFDIPRRSLMRIGKSDKGRLGNPLGLALDKEYNLYVADSGSKQVVVYNATGHFLKRIGSSEDLVRPSDVAVSADGSRIYVVDSGGLDSNLHKVVIYDAAGEKLGAIGRRGSGEGEFNLPVSIAMGPDGNIYVLDAGNFRIQVFDAEGQFIRAWGQIGRGLGNFARPRGLAIDPDGNVYVTDASYRNFQLFTPDGRLLMYIGGGGLSDKPGQYVLPAGIAVDETYRVYVVDQMFKKVDIIRRLGSEEAKVLQARQLQKMAKRKAKSSQLGQSQAPAPKAVVPGGGPGSSGAAAAVDPLVEQLQQLNAKPEPVTPEKAPADLQEQSVVDTVSNEQPSLDAEGSQADEMPEPVTLEAPGTAETLSAAEETPDTGGALPVVEAIPGAAETLPVEAQPGIDPGNKSEAADQ